MCKRIHQIIFFLDITSEVQDKVVQYLIENGKLIHYGEEYIFLEINSYSDFTKKITLRTYEQLFPYIERTRKGEIVVLWPGEIKMFAKSSGNTNDRSKYI